MKVYRVILTEFDTLENEISAARRSSCIGAFAEEATAERFAGDYVNRPSYRGWDGVTYPITRVEVEEVIEG